MAWFYVLLVNSRQQIDAVHAVLDELSADDTAVGYDPSDPGAVDSVFAPHNIFWHKPRIAIDPQGEALWRQALDLGLVLLQAGVGTDSVWPDETFEQQIDNLRTAVRTALFQASPRTGPQEKEGANGNDQQIASIVAKILQQWPPQEAASPAVQAKSPESTQIVPAAQELHPNEDGDIEETVMLSSRPIPDSDAGRPADPAQDNEKTVVITPRASQGRPARAEEELEKTVLIAPQHPTGIPRAATPPDLEKTVVIDQAPQSPDDDDMDKTVIISPPKAPGRDQSTAAKPTDEDELEPTVIIDPRQTKPGKPKP